MLDFDVAIMKRYSYKDDDEYDSFILSVVHNIDDLKKEIIKDARKKYSFDSLQNVKNNVYRVNGSTIISLQQFLRPGFALSCEITITDNMVIVDADECTVSYVIGPYSNIKHINLTEIFKLEDFI